jgi:hypothetical protein
MREWDERFITRESLGKNGESLVDPDGIGLSDRAKQVLRYERNLFLETGWYRPTWVPVSEKGFLYCKEYV